MLMPGVPSVHWDRTGTRRRLVVPWHEIRDQETRRVVREHWFAWHAAHAWHTSASGRLVLRMWHGQPYRDGPQHQLTRARNAELVERYGAYGTRIGGVMPIVTRCRHTGHDQAERRP